MFSQKQIDVIGFHAFILLFGFHDYRHLEEQERALAAELPKLQGELDALEMRQISASEVVAEAANLHRLWDQLAFENKRKIIEAITEKIVVSGNSVDITLGCMPSTEEFAKGQRNVSLIVGITPPCPEAGGKSEWLGAEHIPGNTCEHNRGRCHG